MTKPRLKLIYEIGMLVLALSSLPSIWIENNYLRIYDWIIWGIFVIDVAVRFFMAENKWQHVKNNSLDFITIIPLDAIFRLARLARLFRVFRILNMSSHYFKPVFKILHTNGLNKLITFTVVLIFVGAIPVFLVEPGINTYEDALWWSIVTTTTVGYGDMSPVTVLGRSIAVILMIVGIGLISMITGTIATYFISAEKKPTPTSVDFIKKELDRYDELTEDDMDTLITIMCKMRDDKVKKDSPSEREREKVY